MYIVDILIQDIFEYSLNNHYMKKYSNVVSWRKRPKISVEL